MILISSDAKMIRKLTSAPKAIHRFTAVSRDGRYIALYSNERNPRYFDVYLYDFKEDKLRRVLALDTFLIPLEFSPKGDKLVVTEYLSNVEQKLIMLDLRTNSWKYLNLPSSEYSSISWLPGENAFLFVTDLNEEYPYIARYDLRTGKWKKVYSDLKNVEELKVSPDGRFIAISLNWNGYSKLYLIDRLTSKRELIPVPKGVIYSLEFSRDSRYLAINLSRSTYPASIYLYDLNKGKLMLTVKPNLNGFTESDFIEPKLVFYKSFDGEKIPAFLYLPKEIKGKVPCIIWYHGGPEGQARPNFSTFAQLMTSLGFAVLRPNIRGSSGYGKSWLEADNVRNRWVSLKDGYWANLYVRSLDFIDKDRIYAYGGSYGGYMVMAELTFWPDAWRAGIEVVGISDMISFLEKTGPWRRKLRISEYGDPEKDREFLIEVSPYYHAERIKAPLLVIHGKNDPRVPVEQAYKIVNRLKELNKPVEAMIFEDEGHGVGKFQNRLKVYLRILKFLGISER